MGRKNSTVGDSKDREIVGIVPMPIPLPLKTLREGQIPVRAVALDYDQSIHLRSWQQLNNQLFTSRRPKDPHRGAFMVPPGYKPAKRAWNKHDCLAAWFAAPVWHFVWMMSFGRMGTKMWRWSEVVIPRMKPPTPHQIPLVVNP
ncbi:hypothetical protein LCGC14_2488130 [marine sediment metagenome]|uniref:Uncharacterized protein n=1 Tax=marine sediment metagenome TaxID=412755 RepID=A0A0F9B6C2_9ZZZZ